MPQIMRRYIWKIIIPYKVIKPSCNSIWISWLKRITFYAKQKCFINFYIRIFFAPELLKLYKHKYIRKEDVPSKTMFVIITDGYENASRRYTSDKVKKSIEKHKKHGWEFVFIGANIDAVETAGHFGIGADRAINYCSDNIGTGKVYDAVAKATVAMRCCSEETFEEEMCASFAEVNADFNKRGKR